MNSWVRALRVGDRGTFGGTLYFVAGAIACLQPDSSFWTEWLLVPDGERPQDALKNGRARWLSLEEDVGIVLWTPIELPAGVLPGEVEQLTKLSFAGRDYRRQERDRYTVSRIDGDVGGDSARDERVEYMELLAGSERLCLEWNADGIDAFRGSKTTAAAVRDAFRGVPLQVRALGATGAANPVTRAPAASTYDADRRTSELWGTVIGLVIVIPVILLENCASDCQTARVNPTTGKTEYVCANGSVRSSRPWFGK